MNILITGAKGFIGRSLLLDLSKTYNVFSLENGDVYSFQNKKIVCNLLNKKHLDLMLKEKLNIDILIHTASKLADEKNLQSSLLLQHNILIYENLVEIILHYNPSQVINLSSTAVYPNKDGVYKEDSEIKPSENNDGYYGISKFVGENILEFKCKNTLVLNLRLAHVYGNGMRKDRVYEVMKQDLINKNIIYVYGMGRRVCGFVHINLLIKKIKICIIEELKGVFNIVDENLSFKQLALKLIREIGNKESKIEFSDIGASNKTFIDGQKFRRIEKKYDL